MVKKFIRMIISMALYLKKDLKLASGCGCWKGCWLLDMGGCVLWWTVEGISYAITRYGRIW